MQRTDTLATKRRSGTDRRGIHSRFNLTPATRYFRHLFRRKFNDMIHLNLSYLSGPRR